MEIIKRGTPPSERYFESSCLSCHTKVRFQEKEARYTCYRNDPEWHVECPVCNGTITATERSRVNGPQSFGEHLGH